jgi:hypothetical protein
MKVQLKPEPVFTINVGEQTLGRFRKSSAWEGFMKLESEEKPRQFLIVMTEQSSTTQAIETLMGEILGSSNGSEYLIVAASPDLILKLKEAGESVPVGAAPISRDQLSRWHEGIRVLMEQAGVESSPLIAEVFRAWESTGVPVGASDQGE